MAEEPEADITKEPVSVPEGEIIRPKKNGVEPPPEKRIEVELVPDDFLDYQTGFPSPPPPPIVVDAPVMFDIETTGPNPWNARIICISANDLRQPTPDIVTFVDKDEQKMVNDFVTWYNDNGFNKNIGFLVSFDIRFIFAKCLRYLIPFPNFFNADIYDIASILKQVKDEFVYNLNKQGKLDDWAAFLFDKPKGFTARNVFDAWKKGEVDKIVEWNRNDVLLQTLIYAAIIFVKGSE